jgi:pimeloyl-[acyl-carrier protein] methyl ester esterase
VKLLFAHGWGFDRHFWAALSASLPDWTQVLDDRGYFGDPASAQVEGSCLAVTHSFGAMRVLAAPPPGLAGIVAINGFERFTAIAGRPGVPVRLLDRMLRRFEIDPDAVLAEFRRTCGSEQPFGAIDAAVLHADLLRLRDAAPPLPRVPVLALHGGRDPLLPEAMRAASFAGVAQLRRLDHAAGGHLLPLEAPDLCAAAVRGMIAEIAA